MLIPLADFLDRWLVATGVLSAVSLLRWKVTPAKLRRKALAASGLSNECYHVTWERIDERLQAAIDAVSYTHLTLPTILLV